MLSAGRGRQLEAPITATAHTKQLERNILKVVLGNLLFETCYPSLYPEEALYHDTTITTNNNNNNDDDDDDDNNHDDNDDGHGHQRGEARAGPNAHTSQRPPLDRLYVCPWCFRYGRELMPYLTHMVSHRPTVLGGHHLKEMIRLIIMSRGDVRGRDVDHRGS